jgi:uncharacterized repeat protein (TIGR03803 family)
MNRLDWAKRAYGALLLCAAAAVVTPAQTFTPLVRFDGTDGGLPRGALVQATNGNLYGTTQQGGHGGTVYSLTPNGSIMQIFNFDDWNYGAQPVAGLVQGADGNLYGTTEWGGTSSAGTVFKITPTGTLTNLYNFCSQSNCADGAHPEGALIQAADGNFYGTTYYGGANDTCNPAGGCGTVFRITPNGELTTLYSFCSQENCADGGQPEGALVQASDGNLYGTTTEGGNEAKSLCTPWGCGTVFRITLTGKLKTVYTFCSFGDCTDGTTPEAGLIQATDDNLYGTTLAGGANFGGEVFELTLGGTLTTLYSFCSQAASGICSDGEEPMAALVQATDGNFYGTTGYGGIECGDAPNGCGTIFQVTPGGALTTLYSFCPERGCKYGFLPLGELVQDTSGSFYGTTYYGGDNDEGRYGGGTIFSLSMGLGPFVKTQPASGEVRATVKILGTDLTGATSVTFNGTPAAFTVESGSYIKTTVPAGATAGTVQVVTPGGTLSSNVPFTVVP